MTAEMRSLLKQAIDARVREQLALPGVEFCHECSVAVDVRPMRRSPVLCPECRREALEPVKFPAPVEDFSTLRREEESWITKIGRYVGRLRIPTWTPGMTRQAR